MKRNLFAIIISVLALASCKKDVYYSLNVAASPTEGGTVSPSEGSFLAGETVSIKATPSAEYLFEGWSGDAVGSSNPLSVVMDSDKSIVANFIKKSYSLAIEVEGCGHVEEKLLYTKSDYESGSSVELTAIPDEYWTFDHWEGDLSGNDNPKTIDVTSASSVKAVFVKPQYSFNVKIVGPGVVDEYLVETKSGLDAGAQVLLKAIPSEGSVFLGWSGDAFGDAVDMTISLDSDKEIVATFKKPVKTYAKFDYKLPSVKQKCLYFCHDFEALGISNVNGFCPVDYNQDGYLDVVVSNTDWSYDGRFPLRFFLGTKDGGFVADEKNDKQMMGLNNIRKAITGDYNNDGFIDFFLIGHGYDAEPFPGEYPVALISESDGRYHDVRFTDLVSFYHGGASADIDNDGDLDIVLVDGGRGNEVILINDGDGNFSSHPELLDHSLLSGFYTADMIDIDNDGYADLISGLDDVSSTWLDPMLPFDGDYSNMSIVFWGNGEDYCHGEYTRLPKTQYKGMGLVLDYEFFDIDNDGKDEIFLSRTGDSIFGSNYEGWAIQIVKQDGRCFTDITDEYINPVDGCERNAVPFYWIDFEEIDGNIFMVGRVGSKTVKLFKFDNGRLERVRDNLGSNTNQHKHGFTIYSEGYGDVKPFLNQGCTTNPYMGETCMHFHDWGLWNGFSVDYEDFVDFSLLEQNDYCLEFAIKNEDPDLYMVFAFETRLQTEPWYFPTYAGSYQAENYKCNGEWEVVRIPLSDMTCDEEWRSGYYWNTIKTINVMVGDCHGKDFYLDEIRIRKIVDLE